MTEIGGIQIGDGEQVYIVAEAGSNHNDSLDTAYKLVEAAAYAGADACKFQFYRANSLYPGTTTPHAIPDEWLPKLQAACQQHQLAFFCSIFDRETLNAYLQTNPQAIKIASPEATNLPLLEEAACAELPLIVSTGAMTWDDLDRSVPVLADTNTILLHCVAAYPAPLDELNLACIRRMHYRYGFPVGFSDHTTGEYTLAPRLAVAAGACMIEKHLTLNSAQEGPDHPFALNPHEFERLVQAIRTVEEIVGDGEKQVAASEDPADRRPARAVCA